MNPLTAILILLVRVYRAVISPAQIFLFGAGTGCRFEPSCSAYAVTALQTHGAAHGSWLAAKRICRCHPWGGGGHDPVPSANLKFEISDLKSAAPPARLTFTKLDSLSHG